MRSAELSAIATELRIAAFRLSRRLRAERADDGITDSQLTVLMHLTAHGPSTLGAIADHEGVSSPSMNRTVNALEERAAVRRIADPADGRKVVIELTEVGKGIVEATRRVRNAWIEHELDGLEPADLLAVRRAAEIMTRMAGR